MISLPFISNHRMLKIDRMISLPFISGFLMSVNFLIIWAIPIMGMGSLYKSLLKIFLQPIYNSLESNMAIRSFASEYIYTKSLHADFFAMSLLTIVSLSCGLATMFYWQIKYGYLPYWLIFIYYCSWVGIGGSMMGGAYGLAHKEGHNQGLYKKWIKISVGNIFENWLGIFYGNVPFNFSTSHIFIHHKLDGGIGDTFYEWDIDRSNMADFMLYVHRVFLHMVGYSSLKLFVCNGAKAKADLLKQGIIRYWTVVLGFFLVTRSLSFVFWMFIQPLLCMSYFLALINIGFHGFIEYEENGKSIPCVNSTTIMDGEDDMFGEDDHMAHHYNSSVYFKDLKSLQDSKIEEFKKHKASVFQKLSVVELSIFILLGLWDKLADHYKDFTGTMTRDEIKELLRIRAQRIEITYEKYEQYMANPTLEARKSMETIQQMRKMSNK